MNIILCGPPLAGKTTLGQQMAQELQWKFLDTDRLLEKLYIEKTGISFTCREIFQKEGEKSFRSYEKQVISSLVYVNQCVIATGGGAFQDEENARLLKALGKIIYVKTSMEVLKKRFLERALPAYLEHELDPVAAYERLVYSRNAMYERYADEIYGQ